MRLGQALHGLRQALGVTIVPREELTRRRTLGLLLVVALVFGGAFALGRAPGSEGAAASTDDQSASGTTLAVAHLGNEPVLPALLVRKSRAPARRPAAPPTVTTTTTSPGGFTTGPATPVTGPAPSAPAPTPAPSPAPATPSKPSGGSFDDSG
jgi:hypothetical protein